MKKLIPYIVSLVAPLALYAANSVQVNTNGVVQYPTNFWTAAGIATTGQLAIITNTLAVMQVLDSSTSNALSVRISANATTGATHTAQIAILQTNTASLAQGVAATNANTIVTNMLVNWAFTNLAINTTGSVTALKFIGDGSGLTGVVSVVTGGVNQVTVGGSNLVGNITLNGAGVVFGGPGTATVTQIEYIERTFAPVTANYEMIWGMPRDETLTLEKVWGKTSDFPATFSIVSQVAGDGWRVYSTNTAPIAANSSGVWCTNFVSSTIASGSVWGIWVSDVDPRTTNLTVGIRCHR